MRRILTTILAAMSIYSVASYVDTALLTALAEVESNSNDSAVNEVEDAHGRYQIRRPYLDDANRLLGTSYTLQDMHESWKAERVVRAYLLAYGAAYEKNTGYPASPIVLARIHNGGPRGAEKETTYEYGMRVAMLRSNIITNTTDTTK